MNSHRISSPKTKVLWAGWESDTFRLQQAGWQVSAEQDVASMNCRFAFKNANCRIYGLTNLVNYADMYDAYRDGNFHRQLPPLIIQYMASRMEIRLYDDLSKMQPIDTQPNLLINEEYKNIEDFMIFRPIGKANEIIVAPQEVSQMLDLIIKQQNPKQKDLREKKRKEWRKFTREVNDLSIINFEEKIDPRDKIVAQLITI